MYDVIEKAEVERPRRFRPYSEHKDSGVEWLGEIPAHWEVRRLKEFAAVHLSNVDKKSCDGEIHVQLCNYLDVYYNERITGAIDFMQATATVEQVRRFLLRKGDVLITKDSESWDDIAVPAVVDEDLPQVLCGHHLAHVRPGSKCDGRFLSRLFSAVGPRDQFHVAANGITRFGLGVSEIRTGSFPIPPIEEQHAIVAFLDRETAKIDGLVSRKERLIELLQENRTALITRAVTRGLDPNVPMKDSGVEWLGEIPAHWGVKPLKHLLRTPLAYGVLKPDKYTGDDGIPLIRILDVESRRVSEASLDRLSPGQSLEFRRTIVESGELAVSVVGTIGRAFVGPILLKGANLSRALARLQPEPRQNIHFLRYHFDSSPFSSFVDVVPAGTAQRVLNLGDLAEYRLGIPPATEQDAIVGHINCEVTKTEAIVRRVMEAIDHLKEFRTALISAAVTGKIDVREESR